MDESTLVRNRYNPNAKSVGEQKRVYRRFKWRVALNQREDFDIHRVSMYPKNNLQSFQMYPLSSKHHNFSTISILARWTNFNFLDVCQNAIKFCFRKVNDIRWENCFWKIVASSLSTLSREKSARHMRVSVLGAAEYRMIRATTHPRERDAVLSIFKLAAWENFSIRESEDGQLQAGMIRSRYEHDDHLTPFLVLLEIPLLNRRLSILVDVRVCMCVGERTSNFTRNTQSLRYTAVKLHSRACKLQRVNSFYRFCQSKILSAIVHIRSLCSLLMMATALFFSYFRRRVYEISLYSIVLTALKRRRIFYWKSVRILYY